MKAPYRSIILPALVWASVATAAEAPADLESRAAEQERQIRQLEVQNQRLRDQIERLQEQLAAKEDAPPAPPSETPPAAETEPEPDAAAAGQAEVSVHIVKAGESLSKIAKQHATTTAVLAKLNGIRNPSLIREGQRLKLPVSAPAPAPEPTTAETVTGTHTVKAGETFFSIAKIYGLSVETLQAANPDVNPTALRIGQQLKLGARKDPEPAADEPAAPGADASYGSEAIAHKKPVIRKIPITENISFGEFAKRHQMEPAKLNALNGLQLEPKTVLATGSRLYVSAQPLE
ncbi:LysM peptidoglycan-binding domain-containing protein [Haloferula sp. A504]|uniref:LysM peptidoglycan-binding domain-containing protein n=1 Tax=Haloferula sp. A504 TaxID=3373601 RepID=UPI0031C9DEA0|nr:LysM peptidoglycan-binding domain-containing protein [Verrucomicrobiaceae bacterium E54]